MPTLSAPSPSPAAVVTTASPREDLLRQQEDTRSLAKGFLAQPGSRARWEELLESMDELQELGDRLFVEGDLETQNTAESVLEELAELRSEVVELEPALR